MGIDRLRLIETGLDPVTAEREQWDDGNNTLAIEPKVAIAYERNVETKNASRRPVSRRSPSRAPNWVPAAAGHDACPARSAGTRCSLRSVLPGGDPAFAGMT